jgi:hypothetical protein
MARLLAKQILETESIATGIALTPFAPQESRLGDCARKSLNRLAIPPCAEFSPGRGSLE